MLLRMSASVCRRRVQMCMPRFQVTPLTFQRSKLSYNMPNESMVSVSGLQAGGNPGTPIRLLFKSPEEPTKKLSRTPEKSATGQEPKYVSVLFCENGNTADVAWTFAIPHGEDLLEVLERYTETMGQDTSDEYIDVFRDFVRTQGILYKGDTILENTKSEKDISITPERPTGKHKTMESTKILSGKRRDELIKICFHKGKSPVDLAVILGRTPEFILREAKRVLGGEDKLKKHMRRLKGGEWSDGETQWLISRRNQGLPLNTMASFLRRTEPSVYKKLRELGTTILDDSTAVEDGPQELPSWLRETLFSTRLSAIWEGLLEFGMTPAWKEALSEKPAEHWLTIISAGIPEDVKKILGGLKPPTYEELLNLSLFRSTDTGVYAKLVTSRYPFRETAFDRYLFVGSVSQYDSELLVRADQHYREHNKRRLNAEIKKMDLGAPGRSVTLMTMKTDNIDEESVLNMQMTRTLAESILMVWLGVFRSPNPQLQTLCPWDFKALHHRAWSLLEFPLEVDISLPKRDDPKTSLEQDMG
ncbi:hypothetical protein F4810DRAFT_652736 [Camillea tinctor]|nr:hypothetical protein F4810DRAFT_652736 [Camillea tinctor]